MRQTIYGRLLATEVIALLGLRLMQQEPRLTSLVYLLISGVAVLTTTPILQMSWSSPTEARPTSRTIYFERGGLPTLLTLKWMWLSAVLTEAIWQYAIWFRPGLGTHISILHMLTWLALMLALLRRMLHALVAESVINEYVVMGAVAGYLLIGFTGGVMMNSLLTIDPGAFLLNTDNLIINGQLLPASIYYSATILGTAFSSLTTLGTTIINPNNMGGQTIQICIAILGQLYIAILIAGILGKARQWK